MNTSSHHFINVPCNQMAIVNEVLERDPLENAGTDIELTTYYRMENVVFAEPFNVSTEKRSKNDTAISNKEMLSTSDVIQKRIRKENSIPAVDGCYKCSQQSCSKTFKNVSLMRAHVRKVHCADRSRYICEFCSMGFPALYLMRRHVLTHGGEKVECPVCQQRFSPRTDMRVHLLTHSGVRKHQCSVCCKKFTRSSVLATHLKSVHKV